MIIWPNHDLALTYGQHRPTQRQRPEPGQAPQIVSVHDDMVQRHRHFLSMHGDQPVSFPCVGHSDRLSLMKPPPASPTRTAATRPTNDGRRPFGLEGRGPRRRCASGACFGRFAFCRDTKACASAYISRPAKPAGPPKRFCRTDYGQAPGCGTLSGQVTLEGRADPVDDLLPLHVHQRRECQDVAAQRHAEDLGGGQCRTQGSALRIFGRGCWWRSTDIDSRSRSAPPWPGQPRHGSCVRRGIC